MGVSSWLATVLDQEMIERVSGKSISSRLESFEALSPRNVDEVVAELGKRYLLRYLLPNQVGLFRTGSDEPHYVTPTPYSPEETVSWLFLPAPRQPRTYVLLLDPQKMDDKPIKGPRWVPLGKGIEYYLPKGFPPRAVVGKWEMVVT